MAKFTGGDWDGMDVPKPGKPLVAPEPEPYEPVGPPELPEPPEEPDAEPDPEPVPA